MSSMLEMPWVDAISFLGRCLFLSTISPGRVRSLSGLEVFAGMASITDEALSRQLRAVQPIDAVHGVCQGGFQETDSTVGRSLSFLGAWRGKFDAIRGCCWQPST